MPSLSWRKKRKRDYLRWRRETRQPAEAPLDGVDQKRVQREEKAPGGRSALAERASVRAAAPPDYPMRLERFLLARGSELSRRMSMKEVA